MRWTKVQDLAPRVWDIETLKKPLPGPTISSACNTVCDERRSDDVAPRTYKRSLITSKYQLDRSTTLKRCNACAPEQINAQVCVLHLFYKWWLTKYTYALMDTSANPTVLLLLC